MNLPFIQNMMEFILEQYLPGIGNWNNVAVLEVNNGVHCCLFRYRGNATTYIKYKINVSNCMPISKRYPL